MKRFFSLLILTIAFGRHKVAAADTSFKWVARHRLAALAATVALACATLHSPTLVAGENVTARQLEIARQIGGINGFLTQRTHEEFWAAMPDFVQTEASENASFLSTIQNWALTKGRFEAEAWRSIKVSFEAKRVIRDDAYVSALQALRTLYRDMGQEDKAEREILTTDSIIRAVAEGKPFVTDDGEVTFTEETIEELSTAMDAALARHLVLFNPDWPSRPVERAYRDAHVAISSHFPFQVRYYDQTDFIEFPALDKVLGKSFDALRASKTKSFEQRVDDEELVGVSFRALGANLESSDDVLEVVARNMVFLSGLKDHDLLQADWMGYRSVVLNGVFEESGARSFASQRLVLLSDQVGVLLVSGLAQSSSDRARILREELEGAIRVLE